MRRPTVCKSIMASTFRPIEPLSQSLSSSLSSSSSSSPSESTSSPPKYPYPSYSSDKNAAAAAAAASPTTPAGDATISKHSPSSSLWSDLPRRLTTIAIGLPFVCIVLSKPTTALVFFQVVHLLACVEWINLERVKDDASSSSSKTTTTNGKKITMTSTLFYCFINWYLASSDLLLPSPSATSNLSSLSSSCAIFSVCSILLLTSWYTKHDIMGIIFITIPFAAWYKLCTHPPTTAHILWIVWNCDNGALIFGRLYSSFKSFRKRRQPKLKFDQPKWLTNISPKKSMQGLIGGFVTGYTCHALWPVVGIQLFPVVNLLSWQYGIIICLLAIAGDLLESSIKRSCAVKDSNLGDSTFKQTQLPGHGGILDRFDSSLLVAVFYYVYVQEWNIYV